MISFMQRNCEAILQQPAPILSLIRSTSLLPHSFHSARVAGTESGWPWLLAISAVPALISLALLPLCPESPRFLLINKRDDKAAEEGTYAITLGLYSGVIW
jgi:hypothetical protein